jgi:S1-C subfamily serine protease
MAAILALTIAGCTTPVQIRYAGTGSQISDALKSVGNVEVRPYTAPFFLSSGTVVVDTPHLSPFAHLELSESIKAAIQRAGGLTGVSGAPTLRIDIQQCTLRWDSRGGGIVAEAQVVLTGTVESDNVVKERLLGRGVVRNGPFGVVLASTAQPMVTEAASAAIDMLVGFRSEPSVHSASNKVPPTQSTSSGTGFFISRSGHVATAAHVVANRSDLKVSFDGRMFAATVVAHSPSIDLAILKIDAVETPHLPIAARGSEALGDPIFTIGYPVSSLVGSQPIYSEGAVSALSGIDADKSFMQISAPIQPGNSGGPVVLDDGRVIGVVTSTAAIGSFVRMTGTLPQNINWAVRSDLLLTLMDSHLPVEQFKPIPAKKDAVERVKLAIVQVVAK